MPNALISLAPFSALLAFLYLLLTVHVIRHRNRLKLALGTTADDGLQRAVRAHGNFAEFAPFALLLIALLALLGASAPTITALGLALVIGRVSHAYSIIVAEPATMRWRIIGMLLTFGVLAISAVLLLWHWCASMG